MVIKNIKTNDLKNMKGNEGLILQGCGGELQEWIDGINDLLTKEGILLDGSRFENCLSFQYGDLICLLFLFDDVKICYGKLSVWRIKSRDVFGGIWLSDFIDNRLGGYIGQLNM